MTRPGSIERAGNAWLVAVEKVAGRLAGLIAFWRHPRRVTRKWRFARRTPRPSDLERLSRSEFEDFLSDTAFDRRITSALY
jgi:hypothetical protein